VTDTCIRQPQCEPIERAHMQIHTRLIGRPRAIHCRSSHAASSDNGHRPPMLRPQPTSAAETAMYTTRRSVSATAGGTGGTDQSNSTGRWKYTLFLGARSHQSVTHTHTHTHTHRVGWLGD